MGLQYLHIVVLPKMWKFFFFKLFAVHQQNWPSLTVAGAATDDTSHVLLRGSRDSQHKPQSESFVISQPLGFSPNQT